MGTKKLGKKSAVLLLSGWLFCTVWTGSAAAEPTAVNREAMVHESPAHLVIHEVGSVAVNKKKPTAAEDLIPQIIKDVTPSVVGIIGKSSGERYVGVDERYNLMHGSGIIVKSNGWIITNAHVVKDLQNTVVVTSDGKTYKIIDTYLDEVSDLALIKINAAALKPAKLAKSASNARVGEKVIAIGTPISFALRSSATMGVISGLNRTVDASYRLIQSDTAINPGNSGGPLINMKGEVLGINSLKYSAIGVENMGFAIPSETVQYIMNQLFKYGEVKRPSLGLELEASWSSLVGLPTEDPLTVTKVNSSGARKAGILEGDVLYSIDGHRVTSNVDINELFKGYAPGSVVRLMMQSEGDIVIRKLVLGQGDPVVTGEETETEED
ncbi:S1C family serine protease [Paenibacillus wynnii]|uniref:S1C family serine protease n=1 Tax=Paenibacillus wynnii TaxID=268407 RepID=UPI0027D862CA|nr:trypsin-like peptidase domain-containing protein [Paenibacillus wynnii]